MNKPVYVFVNRVYPPAGGATGELLREMAEGLVADGARVVVVTGSAGERPGKLQRETVNGVEVVRVWSPPLRRSSHWKRALDYAVLYPQFAWHVARLGSVEAVVSMTDPPMQMILAPWAGMRAWRKIHWAQDVYPDLAVKLGVIPEGSLLAKLLAYFANHALRSHDDVVVPGRCMREALISRGISARRLEVIPNWSAIKAASADEVSAMRRRHGWGEEFVVLYSGNLGLAHDFDTVADAVRHCEGARIRFVIAGEGPRLDQLREAMAGFPRVTFLPPQPKQDLAAFLGAPDIHLVTVGKGLSGLVVPSKTYGILAAGRPIIYVGGPTDEVARVITEAGAGIVVKNGDGAGLAKVLRELAGSGSRVDRMAAGAQEASRDFTLAKAMAKWRGLFQ
ncbi:MAG: glycosyltransferase family 4 protein [Chthoniobacterales bacterium]|nr:glycosyltransferase family 4 protein [Chthoniobacterales bacterium]